MKATFMALHPQVGLSCMDRRRPIADPWIIEDVPTSPTPTFTAADYMTVVRRGSNATAGGMNGVTYKQLKIIFSVNDHLAQLYTSYLNDILAGKASRTEMDLLNASRGVGIPKSAEGDIRPIAVGHIVLRLLGSMALRTVASDVQDFFMPHQFGCGTRDGCALMINAIQANLRINPEYVCISCDSKNAFNTFDRSLIWAPLRQHFRSWRLLCD